MWCQSAPSGTTLPHHKQMDLLKKVSNMDLLFFSAKNSLNINIRENAHPEFLDPRNIQPVNLQFDSFSGTRRGKGTFEVL